MVFVFETDEGFRAPNARPHGMDWAAAAGRGVRKHARTHLHRAETASLYCRIHAPLLSGQEETGSLNTLSHRYRKQKNSTLLVVLVVVLLLLRNDTIRGVCGRIRENPARGSFR